MYVVYPMPLESLKSEEVQCFKSKTVLSLKENNASPLLLLQSRSVLFSSYQGVWEAITESVSFIHSAWHFQE